MAEISVPAWPMPIHQTKLTMSKPQPTGMLMPQMPMPSTSEIADATAAARRPARTRSRSRTTSRASVLRVSTIALILSVTVREGVARRDDRRPRSVVRRCLSRHRALQLRGRGSGCCTAARYVVRGRVFSSSSRRVVAAARPCSLRDPAVRVVQVAEDDRLGRARRLAGGHDLAVADRPALAFSASMRAGADALHAVGALLHHAAAAHRHVGVAS